MVWAHTSKVGYHELEQRTYWYYGTKMSTNPSIRYGGLPRRGISYKSQTVKSDGKRATSYSRCVGLISEAGGSGSFKTGSHHVKYDGAFVTQMMSLDATGGGCQLSTGQVYIPDYLEGAAINQALTKLSTISSNILEDLAQATQVAQMAGQIYNKIWDLFFIWQMKGRRLRTYLKYLRSHVRDFPVNAGEAWLFWHYGIKPLVNTFNAVVSTYKGGRYQISGNAQRSDTVSITQFVTGGSAGFITGTAERSVQVRLRATIKTTSSLQYWRGLGLSGTSGNQATAADIDGIVTLWAITPYSFVVDWFIPVETWLRTLSWNPQVEYTSGYISRRIKGSGTCIATHFSGAKILEGTAPRSRVDLLYFQRVAYNTIPPLSRLYLNVSLNPNQLKSAAALIALRGALAPLA